MADNRNARLYARAYMPGGRAFVSPSTGRRTMPSGKTTTDPCKPACADCGLLECLCRPRFFAGQLLSEQDLNRLDAYIRAKNRLHTLQLHGWGVVNGLQVRCDPCGSGVIVGTGYAIDPCGQDIIVCDDTSVDICALIKQCQTSDIRCEPTSRGGADRCGDLVEEWVLAIRYSETPTKGVTALRMGSTCGCNSTGGTCSTTGTSQCGCGGATAKTTSTTPSNHVHESTTAKKPRGASPECEPTAVCETYSFDVYKAPVVRGNRRGRMLGGALVDAFWCCMQPLVDAIPTPPAKPLKANFVDQPLATRRKWTNWCCGVKDALIGYFANGPQANCRLMDAVGQLQCPDPENSQTFPDAMLAAWQDIKRLLTEAALACACSALMPPAPFGTSDDRVPLAVVSVRKRDCKVLEVCNWTPERKLVLTFPTLQYWLSWVPILQSLPEMLSKLCCGDAEVASPPREGVRLNRDATAELNPELDDASAADNKTMVELIDATFERGEDLVDAAAFVSAVYGFDAASPEPLSAAERDNVAPFVILNGLIKPIALSLSQDESSPREGGVRIESGRFTVESVDRLREPVVATPPDTRERIAAADTDRLNLRIATLEARIAELERRPR